MNYKYDILVRDYILISTSIEGRMNVSGVHSGRQSKFMYFKKLLRQGRMIAHRGWPTSGGESKSVSSFHHERRTLVLV